MQLLLAFSAIALALAHAAPNSAFTYGHAAYTYGPLHCVSDPCSVVPSCNKAHWAEPIGAFNDDTSISDAKITQIYSATSSSGQTRTPSKLAGHLLTWPTATPPHIMTTTTRPQPLYTPEYPVSSPSLRFLMPVWTAGT